MVDRCNLWLNSCIFDLYNPELKLKYVILINYLLQNVISIIDTNNKHDLSEHYSNLCFYCWKIWFMSITRSAILLFDSVSLLSRYIFLILLVTSEVGNTVDSRLQRAPFEFSWIRLVERLRTPEISILFVTSSSWNICWKRISSATTFSIANLFWPPTFRREMAVQSTALGWPQPQNSSKVHQHAARADFKIPINLSSCIQ